MTIKLLPILYGACHEHDVKRLKAEEMSAVPNGKHPERRPIVETRNKRQGSNFVRLASQTCWQAWKGALLFLSATIHFGSTLLDCNESRVLLAVTVP